MREMGEFKLILALVAFLEFCILTERNCYDIFLGLLTLFFFFLNMQALQHEISFYFILFIYLWLCWVLASVLGPSPIAASGGHPSSWCAGLPPSRPLLLRSTGSGRAGPAIVAHGPSCSAARGILPDRGPNPRPLHWQADSQPLRHQGSPCLPFKNGNPFSILDDSSCLPSGALTLK